MRLRPGLTATTALVLTAAGLGATAGVATAAPGGVPGGVTGDPRATYIVTVAPGTAPAGVANRAKGLGGDVEHVYTAALNGFAVTLPPAAAERLTELPGVVAVEADAAVHASSTQSGAPWGLDRIDQRKLPLGTTYDYTATGTGVTAYIIDSGIAAGHAEFGGRAVAGFDAVTTGGTAADCNGHGTHVAGTVGGSTSGVAKGVQLVAVRVLGCDGSGSNVGVIAGIDWVTANHVPGTPAVANMSLGGGASTALDTAVKNSIATGITYAVAAGNGNAMGRPLDACGTSPARVPAALTVAATDRTDAPASFSNYGACVDLFAPGVGIASTWHTSATAMNTISGTSMATPHVAGVAALYLNGNSTASPATVATAIKALTTKDAVKTAKTANNDLLFSTF